MLASRPNPRDEDHPLSAVRRVLNATYINFNACYVYKLSPSVKYVLQESNLGSIIHAEVVRPITLYRSGKLFLYDVKERLTSNPLSLNNYITHREMTCA